ncbi:hypothetical protein FJ938_22005 [Mesorhizobium sp. B2-4-14]|uniref:hypothetical protein n=1 Tax=Mesorhizobium sp. B2-4-14 TaxID=2589935 RepID=UPI0011290675|nr:hypothetical protein [Mesorhizobium sp. B2-4-14]TPL00671.1 hypothetical protein FJ938_22005 [Mesorhizobium sp. B2-4-14]
MRIVVAVSIGTISLVLAAASAQAQDLALLLFDGATGTKFAGCLNCGRYDDVAVCNKYGDFGSKYSDNSIWNKYGQFGSKYETNSPWNAYGEGLRVVDKDGHYYGRFTLSVAEQSKIGLIQSLLGAYQKTDDLDSLRDLLCE